VVAAEEGEGVHKSVTRRLSTTYYSCPTTTAPYALLTGNEIGIEKGSGAVATALAQTVSHDLCSIMEE